MKIDVIKLAQLINNEKEEPIINTVMYIFNLLWNEPSIINFSQINEDNLKLAMDHIYYYVCMEDEQEEDDNANNLLEIFMNIDSFKTTLIIAPPKGGVNNELSFI